MSAREVATLRRRAERAAAAAIAAHDLAQLNVPYDLLVSLLAVGWLEGWQDSLDAKANAIRQTLAQYQQAGLHSVKVTPCT